MDEHGGFGRAAGARGTAAVALLSCLLLGCALHGRYRQCDERDPDAWQFPEGTRFWKEFRQGGVRIETRMLQKVGALPEDWLAVSYLWKAEGSDADAAPGGVVDAHGTTHDVPAAATCMGCHAGTVSRVLGYSAVQLTRPRDDSVATRATGYLHANCWITAGATRSFE